MDRFVALDWEGVVAHYANGLKPLETFKAQTLLEDVRLNWLDALAMGRIEDIRLVGTTLAEELPQESEEWQHVHDIMTLLALRESSSETLKEFDANLDLKALRYYVAGKELSAKQLEGIPNRTLAAQLTMWQRGRQLGITSAPPIYPVKWSGQVAPPEPETAILLEPIDIDWAALLSPLKKKKLLLLFPSRAIFWHCMQFDGLFEALQTHPWRILTDLGPALEWQPKYIQFCSKREPWVHQQKPILQAMGKGSRTLTKLARELETQEKSRLLGKKRLPAYVNSLDHLPDNWDRYLLGLKPIAGRRTRREEKPAPLAIIAHRMIDNDKYSKLLVDACAKLNRTEYAPTVYCSELLMLRKSEYPAVGNSLPHSKKTGHQCYTELNSDAVTLYFASGHDPYLATAYEIAERLQEQATQVVIFYASDIINDMVAAICDVPVKLFMAPTEPRNPELYDESFKDWGALLEAL